MYADFKPAWWLPSPHLQTLWPAFFRQRAKLNLTHEQFELADGDFLDLCWSQRSEGQVVLLIHGLEGSINSPYASGLFATLESKGYRPVFMHFRGCSGRHNRLDRAYHSGDTQDIAAVVEHITAKTGTPVFAAVGYSLGGNALLKWLGETGVQNPLAKAVVASIPFRLSDAVDRLDMGWSRMYRNYLLGKLQKKIIDKFSSRKSPITVDVASLKSFWDYDEQVTAVLHGFNSAQDYYTKSSCRQYLRSIEIPTQIIHAIDDPFMFKDTAPEPAELSDSIDFQLTRRGGHVGFVCGTLPWRARYWHEEKICQFLKG
ncbi:MAG: hydrolase [Gammaproteobacteria bacterium]|nr:hydrolase [Gammaproteobacteria bacterium]PCH64073.1 MAG: hydrolase [Gammaproteobacteria bacterium]